MASDRIGLPELRHTKIIGLGHKARQGKDTAAQMLIEAAPARVRRFSFADALYAVARVQYGMTRKDPVLLQDLGLNYRSRDADIWVKACLWAIHSWDEDALGPQCAVISDVRFENEFEAVQKLGGKCIRLERYHNGGARYLATDRPLDHPSETALDNYPWDATVENISFEGFRSELMYRAAQWLPEVFAPDDAWIAVSPHP